MRRVVVTGMGVISPIGVGLEAFFAGLHSARPGVDIIQSFDARAFPTRIAGEVKDLTIDSLSLSGDEDEALRRDPKSIFGLLAAREALGLAFGSTRPTQHYRSTRCGAYLASGLEIFHLEDLAGYLTAEAVDGAALLEAVRAHPPLSFLQIPAHLGARCIVREAGIDGPLTINVSACAAGTQAIGEAFRAIRDGRVEMAISGGYDSMINPLGVGGFCLLGALSVSNEARGAASRPFDATRDGFVLGEGAAMVVLEEYEAAQRRQATLFSEILGYASTLDAYRITDPAPDARGAIAAMQGALVDARLTAGAIDYINAHGTGTPKGDVAESRAIHEVFGQDAWRVMVSSTKSQIGHLIGAAGAVEFLAGQCAHLHSIVPATINLNNADPQCDLDYVPRTPRRATVRTVLSNSFGFGGQNASIIFGALR